MSNAVQMAGHAQTYHARIILYASLEHFFAGGW